MSRKMGVGIISCGGIAHSKHLPAIALQGKIWIKEGELK